MCACACVRACVRACVHSYDAKFILFVMCCSVIFLNALMFSILQFFTFSRQRNKIQSIHVLQKTVLS